MCRPSQHCTAMQMTEYLPRRSPKGIFATSRTRIHLWVEPGVQREAVEVPRCFLISLCVWRRFLVLRAPPEFSRRGLGGSSASWWRSGASAERRGGREWAGPGAGRGRQWAGRARGGDWPSRAASAASAALAPQAPSPCTAASLRPLVFASPRLGVPAPER